MCLFHASDPSPLYNFFLATERDKCQSRNYFHCPTPWCQQKHKVRVCVLTGFRWRCFHLISPQSWLCEGGKVQKEARISMEFVSPKEKEPERGADEIFSVCSRLESANPLTPLKAFVWSRPLQLPWHHRQSSVSASRSVSGLLFVFFPPSVAGMHKIQMQLSSLSARASPLFIINLRRQTLIHITCTQPLGRPRSLTHTFT